MDDKMNTVKKLTKLDESRKSLEQAAEWLEYPNSGFQDLISIPRRGEEMIDIMRSLHEEDIDDLNEYLRLKVGERLTKVNAEIKELLDTLGN